MAKRARGTVAAPPAPRRIALDRGDYFELAALAERGRRLEIQAQEAARQFKADLVEASAALSAHLDRLGSTHGFDPRGVFRLEDAGHTLILEDRPKT